MTGGGEHEPNVDPHPRSDEVALLAGAADGDPEAVRGLLDTVGDAVYGFIYNRVGGNAAVAEDLSQETFIEAMRSAHTFRGDAKLRTWMCTIARRRVARHWERERKNEVAERGLHIVEAPTDEIEQRDEVVRALGNLSALHRQVLVMKYLDDRTVAEIASALGRTRVQVQSLLQRARDGLRRHLEASDG